MEIDELGRKKALDAVAKTLRTELTDEEAAVLVQASGGGVFDLRNTGLAVTLVVALRTHSRQVQDRETSPRPLASPKADPAAILDVTNRLLARRPRTSPALARGLAELMVMERRRGRPPGLQSLQLLDYLEQSPRNRSLAEKMEGFNPDGNPQPPYRSRQAFITDAKRTRESFARREARARKNWKRAQAIVQGFQRWLTSEKGQAEVARILRPMRGTGVPTAP